MVSDYICVIDWQRVALLQVWKSFEEQHGTAYDIARWMT
jgi:hypothetical protein